ncbi:hypothetical protein Lesp01_51220 [Lentzea sp. NBRC 102530]|nr:hypothetical protein Lesp01_51220 [Lentzea sp. NBRC 102530]
MWSVGDELPPAMFELAKSFVDRTEGIEKFDDVQFYDEIVFAVRSKYSTDRFVTRRAPELLSVVHRIESRLDRGWFHKIGLTSPQARYASKPEATTGSIQDGVPDTVMQKPQGALWTSSFLPDGRSAWAEQEVASSHSARRLYRVVFAESDVRAYTLDSLSDFTQLLDLYPSVDDVGRVAVAWSKMASDFDAVHMTARGLLAIEGVEVQARNGVGRLVGWDAESTAWFRFPRTTRLDPAEGQATAEI